MDIKTAIDNCTLAELTMIRTTTYMKNWATAPGFWDYLIARQDELTRNEHCDKYNITRDDFGHYATISSDGAYKLMMDQLRCAAQAMLDEANSPYHVSDDGLDYLNAATDQGCLISELLTNDDGLGTYADLLKLLNMTRDEAENNSTFTYAPCLIYGYADHAGPMSDLAKMNDEDEGN